MNYLGYEFDEKLVKLSEEVEEELKRKFKEFEQNSMLWSSRVLKSFQENNLGVNDFTEVTGYGFYDAGRDKLEKVYAELFGAEDALVRPQIMSGTHALTITFFGLLQYGDTMISLTGEPYDSLKTVVGTAGNSKHSIIASGIKYEQIDLINDDFDIPTIVERLKNGGVKLVEIQRSRGYSQRKSLTIDKIERVIKEIKKVNKEVIIMVDNCYGDFVEDKEPTHVGADILVGSSMKNLGAGILRTGAYIVGKKDLIADVAERFSAPCLGKEIGSNFNMLMDFFRALYHAPSVVCSSLKSMAFGSCMLEKMGYTVSPTSKEKRTDIVQAVNLKNADELVKFIQGIQKGAAVESYLTPIPAPMPGYPHDEVGASGSFISGSSIEFSGDAPMVEPFTAFLQGGLTYEYGKLGMMIALQNMLETK